LDAFPKVAWVKIFSERGQLNVLTTALFDNRLVAIIGRLVVGGFPDWT
jgi:hypothetical protein